ADLPDLRGRAETEGNADLEAARRHDPFASAIASATTASRGSLNRFFPRPWRVSSTAHEGGWPRTYRRVTTIPSASVWGSPWAVATNPVKDAPLTENTHRRRRSPR